MKKLLALSIALLSLNLYGAEKLNFSKNGLEGWGKKEGVAVIVEDYSKHDKTFDKKAIENQVKLRLLQAGIKVNDDSGAYIYINALPYHNYIKLNVKARRLVTFTVNGKIYSKVVSVWDFGSIFGKSHLRDSINEDMDKFLLDYLKANPKKNEDPPKPSQISDEQLTKQLKLLGFSDKEIELELEKRKKKED